MKEIILFLIFISLTFVFGTELDSVTKVAIKSNYHEYDYKELVAGDSVIAISSFGGNISNCVGRKQIIDSIDSVVSSVNGNAVLYNEFKNGWFGRCYQADISIFRLSDSAVDEKHNKFNSLINEHKIATKFIGGVSNGKGFGGVGLEYILPYSTLAIFTMPEAMIIADKQKYYIQISPLTVDGFIDFYLSTSINKNIFTKDEIRYGIKYDGGFLLTGILLLFGLPSDILVSGPKQELIKRTFEPYISYSYGNKKYDGQWRVGIVWTNWINKNRFCLHFY